MSSQTGTMIEASVGLILVVALAVLGPLVLGLGLLVLLELAT